MVMYKVMYTLAIRVSSFNTLMMIMICTDWKMLEIERYSKLISEL